jgi:ribosomal protein S18 acetylase RimI-like enzyme
MTPELDFLTDVSDARIVSAFNMAFSDYALKMDERSEAWLHNRMVKNNVDYDCSVGAFVDNDLVGFSLTGIDDWQGVYSAYDAATGIIEDYRGQGLAARMFDFALPRLRDMKVKQFLLEVLQENEPAIKAYSRVGFNITREFDCFIWNPGETPMPGGVVSGNTVFEIRDIDKTQVCQLADHLDFHPSWEVSLSAVSRIPGDVLAYGAFMDGQLVGTLVYFPLMEWLVNLAVHREVRRCSVGTRLLQHLAARLPRETGTVKLINVEKGAGGMKPFLESIGFAYEISQYEMAMKL